MLGSPGMPIFGTSHRRALELTLGWRALRSKMAQSMALALRSVIGSPARDYRLAEVENEASPPSSRQDRTFPLGPRFPESAFEGPVFLGQGSDAESLFTA